MKCRLQPHGVQPCYEREINEAGVAREREAIAMNCAEARGLLSLYYQVKGLPQQDASTPSNAEVVSAPGLDGGFYLLAGQAFVQRAHGKRRQLRIRCKTKRDQLPLRKLPDARSGRFGQQHGEAQSLLQPDDPVLRLECVAPGSFSSQKQCYGQQYP
jgi:hypothetical protein